VVRVRTGTVRDSSRWATSRRLIAVVAIATGGSLMVTPASAHSSSYCAHGQEWIKTSSIWYGSGFLSHRNISYGHLNKYRHWRYYPSTGQIDVMHLDVEKVCNV
jgi:hypothetical protein